MVSGTIVLEEGQIMTTPWIHKPGARNDHPTERQITTLATKTTRGGMRAIDMIEAQTENMQTATTSETEDQDHASTATALVLLRPNVADAPKVHLDHLHPSRWRGDPVHPSHLKLIPSTATIP